MLSMKILSLALFLFNFGFAATTTTTTTDKRSADESNAVTVALPTLYLVGRREQDQASPDINIFVPTTAFKDASTIETSTFACGRSFTLTQIQAEMISTVTSTITAGSVTSTVTETITTASCTHKMKTKTATASAAGPVTKTTTQYATTRTTYIDSEATPLNDAKPSDNPASSQDSSSNLSDADRDLVHRLVEAKFRALLDLFIKEALIPLTEHIKSGSSSKAEPGPASK